MTKKRTAVLLFFWALALIQMEWIFGIPSGWLEGPALRAWCLKKSNSDACYAWGKREDLARDLIQETHKAPPKAREGYQRACDQGNLMACSDLSAWYIRNHQYPESTEVAVKACDGGDAIGCYNLACAHCLQGNQKKAMEFLVLSDKLDRQVITEAEAWKDEDLNCLKDVPEFQRLLDLRPR